VPSASKETTSISSIGFLSTIPNTNTLQARSPHYEILPIRDKIGAVNK